MAIEGGYALPTAVMIRSVLAHRPPGRSIHFVAIVANVPDADIQRLKELATESGVTIEILPPDATPPGPLPGGRVAGQSVYYRLLLPQLAAHLERALWLDGDMLVLRDIGELYDTNLDGAPLAAVQDLAIPYVSSRVGVAAWRELGLDSHQPYFNAGLMLMDLKLWRDRNLASLVRGHYRSRPVNLFDQDALNAILGDVWKPLDLRWNVTASVAGRRFFRSPIADFAALGELARNPWLLHYSGDWKPWTLPYGRHPYELFFQYLDETPWRGWRPPATARARIRAFYHEYLRDTLYPIETAMAERRVRGWL